MRIPDPVLDSVCYVTTYRGGRPMTVGTGFFTFADLGFENNVVPYVVTATHCLYDKLGEAEEVGVRLNTYSGGADEVRRRYRHGKSMPLRT